MRVEAGVAVAGGGRGGGSAGGGGAGEEIKSFGQYLLPQANAGGGANFMMAATVRDVPVPGLPGGGGGSVSVSRSDAAGKTAPTARRRLDTNEQAVVDCGAGGASVGEGKEAAMHRQLALQQQQIADLAQLVQALQVCLWLGHSLALSRVRSSRACVRARTYILCMRVFARVPTCCVCVFARVHVACPSLQWASETTKCIPNCLPPMHPAFHPVQPSCCTSLPTAEPAGSASSAARRGTGTGSAMLHRHPARRIQPEPLLRGSIRHGRAGAAR